MKHIIIIGSRGYQYHYGGWETFVTNLVKNTQDKNIQYYIPNLTDEKQKDKQIDTVDKVISPNIYVPKQGFVTMFTFTIKAMNYFLKYTKKEKIEEPIFLLLGCKVGPLLPFWLPRLRKRKAHLIINPDGLEWKREKWSWWIKICFKISEYFSVKYSDLCVCDSKMIQEYITKTYQKQKTPTTFIAYGAYENLSVKRNLKIKKLFEENHMKEKEYALIVGRFIPENNYEIIIKEFLKTSLKKDLVIVSNVEENKFYQYLKETTQFPKDLRIKFIGPVYDENVLLYLRQNAFAYIHGHSVGGTNPSLLEALSSTDVNILFDVGYNREVGEDACLYFTKEENSLKSILEEVNHWDEERKWYGKKAKKRIHDAYTWDLVVEKYEEVFDSLLEK